LGQIRKSFHIDVEWLRVVFVVHLKLLIVRFFGNQLKHRGDILVSALALSEPD
jgi:hypothetical protein